MSIALSCHALPFIILLKIRDRRSCLFTFLIMTVEYLDVKLSWCLSLFHNAWTLIHRRQQQWNCLLITAWRRFLLKWFQYVLSKCLLRRLWTEVLIDLSLQHAYTWESSSVTADQCKALLIVRCFSWDLSIDFIWSNVNRDSY